MKKVRYKNALQRPVTARFSADVYAELHAEAEDLGTTVADVLRLAWSAYKSHRSLESSLNSLETRMIRKFFEISVATCGLDENERKEALRQARELIARGDGK